MTWNQPKKMLTMIVMQMKFMMILITACHPRQFAAHLREPWLMDTLKRILNIDILTNAAWCYLLISLDLRNPKSGHQTNCFEWRVEMKFNYCNVDKNHNDAVSSSLVLILMKGSDHFFEWRVIFLIKADHIMIIRKMMMIRIIMAITDPCHAGQSAALHCHHPWSQYYHLLQKT